MIAICLKVTRIISPVIAALCFTAIPAVMMQLYSTSAGAADPNAFNRLMQPPSKRNPPPAQDGIHDKNSATVGSLQAPKDAFSGLPKASSGNYVDWVKSLQTSKIAPRFDRIDPKAKPIVMDLNIVREVKGSMPNVVYPHKQHTEWLDCSNCHPVPFVPKKGANKMSMASILLGDGCGLCHGKVAFPVSDCRRCHSQSKSKPPAAATKTMSKEK